MSTSSTFRRGVGRFSRDSTVQPISPPAIVHGGVTASSGSSSVESCLSLSLLSTSFVFKGGRTFGRMDVVTLCLSDKRAAAQAHSNVRFEPCDLLNSTYSRKGGLNGGAIGDDGMLSHIEALGLRFRAGVHGAGIGSSERAATQSNEGRVERPVVAVVSDDVDDKD